MDGLSLARAGIGEIDRYTSENPFTMRNQAIYNSRYYEGEHKFRCACGARTVFYAFQDEDLSWLSSETVPCEECNAAMYYDGYDAGPDFITGGIKSLLDNQHYMAAVLIIASFVEYQIDNLSWALLRDAGLAHEKATAIANGSLQRGDAIRMVRNLIGKKVKDFIVPMRNEVAHGQAFGKGREEYSQEISKEFSAIRGWVDSVASGHVVQRTNYTELDRWLLSMNHWLDYMQPYWKANRAV